jgi:predicted RNA-binding protein associated with RNAse of E/G family
MSGSHYALEPPGKPRFDETTCYDLISFVEREAELALRVDNLVDALAYEARARQALEAQVKALETVAAQHADVLQLVRLHLGI